MLTRKFSLLIILLSAAIFSQAQSRRIIDIPDFGGYRTLKCDFHMHTVFSDGTVWPTVRVNEAWAEGLDAIAITDHIEYRPHSTDIVSDHNRSYELAIPLARQMNLILIRGAEITRSMPPGHLNALFIKNANLLDRKDVNTAIREARDQGAFLIWNHPGWKEQQPDSTIWWPEHTALLRNNMLHGIEVYNNNEFYPEAVEWADQKKLTIFACSDAHGPVYTKDGFRPLTLVFAKSRTEGGIREALFSKRTAAFFNNTLVGNSSLLEPLFFACVEYDKSPLKLVNGDSKLIYIRNNSDIDYELELVQPGIGLDVPDLLTLKAHHITTLTVSGNSDEVAAMREFNLYYMVKNMLTGPDENLVITFTFKNLP